MLTGCGERGFHTALDTSGANGHAASDALLDAVDLLLLDIKTWGDDRYRALTRADLSETMSFTRRLAERHQRTWLRFVVVPGMTDDDAVDDGVAGFAASLGCIERVDVLPVHRLAAAKYEAMGRPYATGDIEPPDDAALARVAARFSANGLAVV